MAEAPLLDELQWLATRRGIRLHLLFGTRGRDVAPDPLAPAEIHRLVPDAATRDVYVCGPASLMDRVRKSMRDLGATDKQIHYELFG
jgi:ferredoxin-NADP reductase